MNRKNFQHLLKTILCFVMLKSYKNVWRNNRSQNNSLLIHFVEPCTYFCSNWLYIKNYFVKNLITYSESYLQWRKKNSFTHKIKNWLCIFFSSSTVYQFFFGKAEAKILLFWLYYSSQRCQLFRNVITNNLKSKY